MRKTFVLAGLFFTLFVGPVLGHAQWARESETPKIEIGMQVSGLRFKEFGEGPVGIGARFHYNFTEHLALDTELTHFPQNPSGNFGETMGLFGVRVGKRLGNVGVFARARGGFMHLGGSDFSLRINQKTFSAFDVGAMVEYYPRRSFALRMEVGDLILPYGGAQYLSQVPPVSLGTRHNLLAGMGVAIRC